MNTLQRKKYVFQSPTVKESKERCDFREHKPIVLPSLHRKDLNWTLDLDFINFTL